MDLSKEVTGPKSHRMMSSVRELLSAVLRCQL